MASLGSVGNETNTLLQKLDAELICGVCLELFDTPVMLPCSHNFCKKCIDSVIDSGMSFSFISLGPPKSFNCPICQAVISIQKFNLGNPVVNRALENIVSLYKTCSPVDIFDYSWNSDLLVTPTTCEEHDLAQDQFCESCSVTICSQCEKRKHQSSKAKHRVVSLKHATVSNQTEIADILTDLKKKLIPLNDRLQYLQNITRTLQDNQESVGKKLEQNMSSLMSHLRERQEDLKLKLETDMVARQWPITEEIKRCQAIKTNVNELMKRLSQVRLTKDPTLKLKLMKNTCNQLMTVLCFDIDHCLQTVDTSVTDSKVPMWDLNIQEVIEAINGLDWKQSLPGPVRGRSEETQTDTVDKIQETHLDPIKQTGRADVIDGDHESGLKLGTENGRIFGDDSNFLDRKKKDKKQTDGKEKDIIPGGLMDVGGNFEEKAPVHKSKGRSSLPVESSLFSESGDVRPKAVANKAKKSYSDRDLKRIESSHSPSNAEALAKFVARRRTMSPSKSSPVLKALDDNMNGSPSRHELEPSQSNQSTITALKSLEKCFEKASIQPKENSSRALPAFKHEIELFSGEKSSRSKHSASSSTDFVDSGIGLVDRGKHIPAGAEPLIVNEAEAITSRDTVKSDTRNSDTDLNDRSDDTYTKTGKLGFSETRRSRIGIDETGDKIDDIKVQTSERGINTIETSKTEMAKTRPNETNVTKEDNLKTETHEAEAQRPENSEFSLSKETQHKGKLLSPHQKSFSKQPIGGSLDFSLGLNAPTEKDGDLKRITQV